MKLLLFIESLTGAGAQRQITNLAVGLKRRGHSVLLATYAPLEFFREHVESHGVDYVCFNKSYRFDPSPVWKLYKTVKRFQPDVVIAFLRTPSIYAEMVKVALPSMNLIVSERAGVDLDGFSKRDRLVSYGHLMADRVTTNSNDYLQRMVDVVPALKARSSVIYNGVDEAFFQRGKDNHALPDSQPEKTVASVHLKNHGIENFTIDWVGPVDFSSDLVKQVNTVITENQLTERWHWYGAVDNLQRVYPSYDALVLPSLYEGVANTMCEAMCCAVPVLATDIADHRHILESAQAGFICEAGNPESLAKVIKAFMQLSQLEKQQMGSHAYYRACELFGMETFLDRWESLCQSTITNQQALA